MGQAGTRLHDAPAPTLEKPAESANKGERSKTEMETGNSKMCKLTSSSATKKDYRREGKRAGRCVRRKVAGLSCKKKKTLEGAITAAEERKFSSEYWKGEGAIPSCWGGKVELSRLPLLKEHVLAGRKFCKENEGRERQQDLQRSGGSE